MSISNEPAANPVTQEPDEATFFKWLESDDEALVSRATQYFFPLDLVDLIHEAMNHRRSVTFRARMFDVISCKRRRLPVDSWLQLYIEKGLTKSPEIKEAIGNVMESHRRSL